MNKSLRNIHSSKQRSSSSSIISLHFNKADEDQLEISYGEKAEPDDNSKQDETTKADQDSSDKASKHRAEIFTASEKIDEEETQKSKLNSRDSTPIRESVVKDYWSRISKRAGSLDCDLGVTEKNVDQNEGWMIFKDIKGKLTKTLEERKQNQILYKNQNKESKTNDLPNLSTFYKETDSDPDRTPTEDKNQESDLKLSPAIEVFDSDNVLSEFDSYIEGELENAKCEILSSSVAKNEQNFSSSKKTPICKNADIASSTLNATNIDQKLVKSCDQIVFTNEVSKNTSENYFHKIATKITSYFYLIKLYWNRLFSKLLIAVIALCIVPVPSWFSGFIAGAFLAGYVTYCLLKPGKPKKEFFIPDFAQISQSNIPVTEVDEPIIYKGWMNELPFDMSYNPDTYHVNCTRSLYIRLDGSYLRVSYPQTNIPKRAMFNERRFDRQFIHQQHYDITGASVELLPVGLAKKRLWSKKYPICLTIHNPKQLALSSSMKDLDSNINTKSPSKKESPVKKLAPRVNENNEIVFYLFSRTDREKDLWYNRFKKASQIKLLKNHSPSSSPDISGYEVLSLENKRTISADFGSLHLNSSNELALAGEEAFTELSLTKKEKFELYMSHLMAPLRSDLSSSLRDKKEKNGKTTVVQNNLSWLNILIGRVFFDFLSEDMWAQCVAEKIQKKLSKIKLPVFLTELSVKDINLGSALPKIHRTSEPNIDQKGLWIDIDLSYNGSFQMTLETKINLLRYKCDPEELSLSDVSKGSESINQALRSPVYNSEEEDSAESSSDEDFPPTEVHENYVEDSNVQSAGGSTGKKILRLVDRLAQSTYFQQAAKYKYIKKAMEDISNTPLILTVEVQWLTGTLALNIPPMPTDRLWYGFRTNPHLSIVARPKLGHHAVTITHVTEWIERKLEFEFQKLLVMPNMDDLIIPIMQPDSDLLKYSL